MKPKALTVKQLIIQIFADIRKVIATNRKVVVRIRKLMVDYRKPIAIINQVHPPFGGIYIFTWYQV